MVMRKPFKGLTPQNPSPLVATPLDKIIYSNLITLTTQPKRFGNLIFHKTNLFYLFSDFLYRHNVTFDNVTTEVEILDTSKCAVSAFLLIVDCNSRAVIKK